MKKILIFFSISLFLFVLLSSNEVEAGVSNIDEIRAVFFHRICAVVYDYDWDTIVATLKSYKFNLCLLHVGVDDYQQSWWGAQKSCMSEAVTACHNNGMEVHILFGFLGGSEFQNFKAIDYRGIPTSWYDPCKNVTREAIKNLTTELARDLDIDGFNFDYIRYAESSTNDNGQSVPSDGISFSDECKTKFVQWLADQGKPPIGSGEWPNAFAPGGSRHAEFMEWRVIPITELVRDTREWMLAYKPNLEFSASVYSLPTWYGTPPDFYRYRIGQDTSDWVAKGYLDFVSPMQYDSDIQIFKDETDMAVNYFVGGPEGKIPLVPFLCSDSDCGVPITTAVFRDEVNYTRYKADGIMVWRYGGPGAGSEAKADIRPYLNKVNETNPNGWFDTFSLQNVRVENITGATATVKWDTNLPTTSRVEYNTTPLFVAIKRNGTDMEYWDIDPVPGYIQQDTANVTNHNITLTGLQNNMIYYYRVQSQDNFGKATSKVYNFTVGEPIYPVNVTGVVTDSSSGLAISGATVACNAYSNTTNSTGGYLIKITSTGSCTLTASKAGYVTNSTLLNFLNNGTYIRNFALDKIVTTRTISGSLKDKNNQPMQGKVIAYQGSTIINSTQFNGAYNLSVTSGIYDIQFNISNIYIKLLSVDVSSNIQDLINYVRYDSNTLYFISYRDNQDFQVLSSNPSRVLLNSSEIATHTLPLNNNTYYYSNGIVYLKVTPDLKSDCIFNCCRNETRYNDKSCYSGYYCSNRVCYAKQACPIDGWKCCLNEEIYLDYACPSGQTCLNHICTSQNKTFGKTNIGGYSDYLYYIDTSVVRSTLTEAGQVTKITAYIRGSWGSSSSVKAGIYSDSGSNPNTLLGTTGTITVPATWGWYNFTFSSPLSLQAGTYHLGLYPAGNDIDIAYDSGASDQLHNEIWQNFPSTWSGGLHRAWNASIYATYTTS